MNFFRKIYVNFSKKIWLLILLVYWLFVQNIFSVESKIEIEPKRFISVRFDPSYYYDSDLEIKQLCDELVSTWKCSGINTVYIKVYDPGYGAVYATDYPLNMQTDYGKLDFLSTFLTVCNQQDVQVFAWIPAFRHKKAWEEHPEWRPKNSNGKDYKSSNNGYLLCTRHKEFRIWWLGFIEDLLMNYPELNGIDIAEPIVSWKYNEACYCEQCMEVYKEHNLINNSRFQKKEFHIIRSQPLTSLLLQTSQKVQSENNQCSITTICTTHEDGTLFSPKEQRFLSGFDLNSILDSAHKPDILNVELIWQQWAEHHQDTVTFSPEWTEHAAEQILLQVKDRTNVVVHPELSIFGNISITDRQFLETLRYAWKGGAWGIDFYDTHQTDKRNLWSHIKTALEYIPVKKVTVYYDPVGLNDAKQIEVLLRHFNTSTTLIPVKDQFSIADQPEADVIFYVGAEYRQSLPGEFIRFISETDKRICWINYNMYHLLQNENSDRGFEYMKLNEKSAYRVFYQNTAFTKLDTSLNIVQINDTVSCRIQATAQSEEQKVPYVIEDNNFWYVADLPTSFVTEGGRHIVFGDLLHDIVGENHQEKHTALIRIEDVNPTTLPGSLKDIADFLGSHNIPFAVGLTPFYLNPADNTAISLSDKPELVKALQHMISKGAAIVMHGVTHQYRGQTTIDYEFWDGLNNAPLFQDSEDYVKERIIRGLEECYNNNIYPIAWETPHYAGSQLDYRVINKFFSTAYERRQTQDILGTDQLLPFFIPSQGDKAQLIPENLGYIPIDDPRADPLVSYARKNLVIRDGFASFFFHPFVSIQVLKELVKRITDLGYSFEDIRNLNNKVTSPLLTIVSGSSEISLDVRDRYLKEFYVNPKGKIKKLRYTEEKQTDILHKKVNCSPGWLYVAKSLFHQKSGFARRISSIFSDSPVKIGRLWQSGSVKTERSPAVPLILIDSEAEGELIRDQKSYKQAFTTAGIDYDTVSVYDLFEIQPRINLIVIPYAAGRQLTEQQSLIILNAVSRGTNVILEKETDLSSRFGITSTGDFKQVNTVRDEYYPQVEIHWKDTGSYKDFEVSIEYVTYYSEVNTDDPLIIGGEYGEGKYLYIATLFDPTTSQGYSRYPYFLDLIQRQFDLWPLVQRNQTEIYFEPGDREDVSIEDLVKMWKEYGFRRIYVSGWHVYPGWTYEYDRLIELAHENAMLVYIWLELPHVNELFWENHPEWRERTATGKEAVVDWRRHMALTEDACLKAVFNELSDLIQKYDWDGINLAELYFESPQGPEVPEIFTPMHTSVREDFQSQYGIDPKEYFDPVSQYYWKNNQEAWNKFVTYRKDLIIELYHKCLTFLHQQNQQKRQPMEIIVTSLDDIHSEELGDHTATDTKRLIELKKEFSFTLQIEDPQQLWHQGPLRYNRLSKTYHNLIGPDTLILDINIVPYRSYKESLAPTRQATGMELINYLYFASQDNNRVALYSESSIYMVDLPWISYCLGWSTKEKFFPDKCEITSENTVSLELDAEEHDNILVNDQLWPAYHKGRLLLPAGTHEIKSMNKISSWISTLKSSVRLVDISGELKSCTMNGQGIELSYHSPIRNYIIINEAPKEIYLDGNKFSAKVYQGISGYSVQLPRGSHEIKIYTETKGGSSRKNISILGSFLIVFVSVLAGSVLLILYTIRFRKRRKQNKQ